MKKQSGLRSFAFFLSICASVISACICVLLMAGEYNSARFELDACNREIQGWEACRQTQPTYYEANSDTVRQCRTNLEQARANFWVKLPKTQLVGLLAAGGLASATVVYLLTYGLVWFIGTAIARFAKAVALTCRGAPRVQIHR